MNITWENREEVLKELTKESCVRFAIFCAELVQHLNDGGILMFTTGSEAGEIWSDNGGENLYHASLSPDEYKQLLKEHVFELIDYKINDKDCNDHTVWFARYKNS